MWRGRVGVSSACAWALLASPAGAAALSVPGVGAWSQWAHRDPTAPFLLSLAALVVVVSLINLFQAGVVVMARSQMRRALALAEDRAAASDRAIAAAARDTRPLIQMRALRLTAFSPSTDKYVIDDEHYMRSIRGDLWNEGSAQGYVMAVRIESRLASTIGAMLPPDETGSVLHGRKPLGVGEIWTPGDPVNAALLDASFEKHLLTLYAWGWVRYTDAHGIVRRSGFAFEYLPSGENPAGGAFRPCGPSHYWYDIEDAPPQ